MRAYGDTLIVAVDAGYFDSIIRQPMPVLFGHIDASRV